MSNSDVAAGLLGVPLLLFIILFAYAAKTGRLDDVRPPRTDVPQRRTYEWLGLVPYVLLAIAVGVLAWLALSFLGSLPGAP